MANLPTADVVGKMLSMLHGSEWAFYVVAASVLGTVVAQSIVVAIQVVAKKEMTGNRKVIASGVVSLLATLTIAFAEGLDLRANAEALLGIFTMIGYFSKLVYRFGTSALFNDMAFTSEKIIEKREVKKEGLG